MAKIEKVDAVEYNNRKILLDDLAGYSIKRINNHFVYDAIVSLENSYAIVERDGKMGMIDINGTEIIPCIYGYVEHFKDGYAVVQGLDNEHYGYVDNTGKETISLQFGMAYEFNEDRAAVKSPITSLWGYIDKLGELVISYKYSQVFSFNEGMAVVCNAVTGLFGYIDSTGAEVIPCKSDYAFNFDNGVATRIEGSKFFVVTNDGTIVETGDFDLGDSPSTQNETKKALTSDTKVNTTYLNKMLAEIKDVSKEIEILTRNDLVGYVRINGLQKELVTDIIYDGAIEFTDGLGALQKNNKWGFVNANGKFITNGFYYYNQLLKETVNYRFTVDIDGLETPVLLPEWYGIKTMNDDNTEKITWYNNERIRDLRYEKNLEEETETIYYDINPKKMN